MLAVLLPMGLLLASCQSSSVIAGTFNAATKIQKKIIDRNAPEHVLVQEDIVYLEHPTLHFDLYQPENIADLGKLPTVVWIHGGGWVGGSKDHARGYFKRLAAEGYNVVAVEYQFAPQTVYPQQLHQVNQALGFLNQHANEFHIDTQRLYLAGDSAGANLASHYAGLLTNQSFAEASSFVPAIDTQKIRGLILHCGIYDLERFVNTAPNEKKVLEWGINSLVEAYTGGKNKDHAFLASISPSRYLSAKYPPVFISGGNKDFLTASQAMPFVAALKQQQIPVTEVFYPESDENLVHEYQFMMDKQASQQTFTRTIEFIKHTAN